ncbi:MAG: hypothetical protein ABR562_06835 [Thermoplasmatota archaeon]|nr:hypothetical protein [Halobacteriales archaeon]
MDGLTFATWWLVAIAILTFGLALVAFVLGYLQYRSAVDTQRGQWLFRLYRAFYENEHHMAIMQLVDGGAPGHAKIATALQSARPAASELQKRIDGFLNFFEFVLALQRRNELAEEDVKEAFEYPIARLCEIPAIQRHVADWKNSYQNLQGRMASTSKA